MAKTLRVIIEEYLESNDYDGLCGENCGCLLSDGLFPCDAPGVDICVPGYKKHCTGKDKCAELCPDPNVGSWCMTTQKGKE